MPEILLPVQTWPSGVQIPALPPDDHSPAREYVAPPTFVDSEPAANQAILLPVKTHLTTVPGLSIEVAESESLAAFPPLGS